MKKIFILSLFCASAFADNKVEVRIDSMENLANNTAIEVCGSARGQNKNATVLVTLTHDTAEYTTLTSTSGKFCQVIKRWNFKGEVSAEGRVLESH